MLRSLVLLLLLVNAAFYAWSQGWLNDVVGIRPDGQHEPQRLNQQIHSDKIVVAGGASAVDASAPGDAASPGTEGENTPSPDQTPDAQAPSATDTADGAPATPASAAGASPGPQAAASTARAGRGICLEAGPFTAPEYASAEALLRPLLPAGLWTRQAVSIQAMWLVYMGPYAEADLLQRKQDELKRIKDLDFEVVRTPANLAQGISLGRFSKRENAENQLEILRERGVRTARIVNLRPAAELQLLRVPRADQDAQVKLSGLRLPQGKGFAACKP